MLELSPAEEFYFEAEGAVWQLPDLIRKSKDPKDVSNRVFSRTQAV